MNISFALFVNENIYSMMVRTQTQYNIEKIFRTMFHFLKVCHKSVSGSLTKITIGNCILEFGNSRAENYSTLMFILECAFFDSFAFFPKTKTTCQQK